MTSTELRETADRVRGIPLHEVLLQAGAERDRYDKAKWRTPESIVSVTGTKFMDWTRGWGGGGAIDLAMHLHGVDFKSAVDLLLRHFPDRAFRREVPRREVGADLRLPVADPYNLSRVSRYLVHERALPQALLEPLLQAGTVYADARANAVFLLLGKETEPMGAELRGTTGRRWRGMAVGSRKDLGYFSVGAAKTAAAVVLCESAIDAISCRALHPDCACISTSGARANPRWLSSLLENGASVYCGFDSDATGDDMARAMIGLYPRVKRLRPTRHDWNDLLTSRR